LTHRGGTISGNGTIETALEFDYAGVQPAEIDLAKEGIETARGITAAKLSAQAAAAEAQFVVGSDLKVDIHEVSCGFAGCELNDLDVEVSWFGTGIRKIPGWTASEKGLPPFMLSMLPLGRRRDSLMEGDDDSEDIRVAAEEAEEIAVVADEAAAFEAEAAKLAAEAAEAARGGE
jgi:hypothetical protein